MKKNIHQTDSKISSLIEKEESRQKNGLTLIASENYPSEAVKQATASILMAKYAEGYPGKRYYSGNQFIDQIEELAIERVKEIFQAEYANVQPHSGSQANQAVYQALLEKGDKVLAMRLDCGGHLSHGSEVNISGQMYDFHHYGVDEKELINFDQIEEKAKEIRPKLIICGASSYPRQIDFEKFAEVAHKYDALLLADVAHIAGLIVAGEHKSCFPYADIVTSTTHKTLRGPRGGLVLAKKEYGKKIDQAVFPGLQGGPMENIIAAKAVCFEEAQQDSFKDYQKQIIKNTQVLAEDLLSEGFALITGGTDNHLLLIDLKDLMSGSEAQNLLEEAGIYTNKNIIPNEPNSAQDPSGLRLGTPALTSRGMQEEQMKKIAQLISRVLKEKKPHEIKKEVEEMASQYPLCN